jgi:hypothetical protein
MKTAVWMLISCMAVMSCVNCKTADCAGQNTLDVLFIDTLSGNNLFFGAEKKYSIDSLSVYELGSSTAIAFSTTKSGYLPPNDSIISVPFNARNLVISYPNVFSDTVTVSTTEQKSKCCGYMIDLSAVFVNNKKIELSAGSYYLLGK